MSFLDPFVFIHEMSTCFPQERWARVQVTLNDGQTFDSEPVQAKWDAESPPCDQELLQKFRHLAREAVESELAEEMEKAVWQCAESQDVQSLMRMFTSSPHYKL